MTNKTILLIILLALLSLQRIFCQSEIHEKQHAFSRLIYNENVALKLNYFEELGLHPGLEIGTDYNSIAIAHLSLDSLFRKFETARQHGW